MTLALCHASLLVILGVGVSAEWFDCRRIGSVCDNGGICTKTKPECACRQPNTFVGHDCSLKVDDVTLTQESCDPSCKNGGVCKLNPLGQYTCYCNAAFHGMDCSKKRGNVICAGDRMTVEVTPFPPFNGLVFIRGKETNNQCKFTKQGDTYIGTFVFNGPCSVEEIPNTPGLGDITYKTEVLILNSKVVETKFDLLLSALCVHSGTGKSDLSGNTGNVDNKPGGGDKSEETTSSTYQPVIFELQTISGSNIVPPVFIGNELRLYFALYDTGKYKKIYIVDCVALNGLAGPDLRSLTLVKDGCTTEEGSSVVIGQVVVNNLIPAAIVNFKVFKFVNSDSLSFQCNIRVCTAAETDCDPPLFCPRTNSVRAKRDTMRHARNFTFSSPKFVVNNKDPEIEKDKIKSDKDILLSNPEKCFESNEMLSILIILVIAVIVIIGVMLWVAVKIIKTRSERTMHRINGKRLRSEDRRRLAF